jgi:ABC-type Fe3+-siderophore transport system permease subunit
MQLTKTERLLLKEAIIAEYKLKNAKKLEKKRPGYYYFVKRLKKIMPLNILVGVVASVVLVYSNGWRMFVYLLLSGVIWITLISSLVSALVNVGDKN